MAGSSVRRKCRFDAVGTARPGLETVLPNHDPEMIGKPFCDTFYGRPVTC